MVESPCDSALIPDGAALSAFQYFENVRNFLVAIQDMGVPTFEASDLEQVCMKRERERETMMTRWVERGSFFD